MGVSAGQESRTARERKKIVAASYGALAWASDPWHLGERGPLRPRPCWVWSSAGWGLGRRQLNTDVWHGVAADAAVTWKARRRGNAHLIQLRGNVHAFISSLSFHQCLVLLDRPQRPQPATLPTQHAAPAVSFLLPDQPPLMASQFDTAYHARHLGIAFSSGERSTGLSSF